ncbi:hypothetical protein ACKWTF_010632 [Chironomus riparius]
MIPLMIKIQKCELRNGTSIRSSKKVDWWASVRKIDIFHQKIKGKIGNCSFYLDFWTTIHDYGLGNRVIGSESEFCACCDYSFLSLRDKVIEEHLKKKQVK